MTHDWCGRWVILLTEDLPLTHVGLTEIASEENRLCQFQSGDSGTGRRLPRTVAQCSRDIVGEGRSGGMLELLHDMISSLAPDIAVVAFLAAIVVAAMAVTAMPIDALFDLSLASIAPQYVHSKAPLAFVSRLAR